MARRGRTPRIEKLRRKGDLEGLKRAAGYTDVLVGRSGELVDRGASVRAAALRGLSDFYGNDVVEVLAAAVDDPSDDVRYAAVEGLGRIHSSAAYSALLQFLARGQAEEQPLVRALALESLCSSGREGLAERWAQQVVLLREGPLVDGDRNDLRGLLASDDRRYGEQRLYDALARYLRPGGADDGGVARAEQILLWCDPGPLHGLEQLLTDGVVLPAVIRIAGHSGDQRMIAPLSALLGHPDAETRRAAAVALGDIRDTQAVIPLLRATRDEELAVRRSALEALDLLGSAGVTVAVTMLVQASLGPGAGQGEMAPGGWAEQTLGRLLGGGEPPDTGADGVVEVDSNDLRSA